MLYADSSILWSNPTEMPRPEQIDGWLFEATNGSVYPPVGIGAVYCLWGRIYGVRPEVLVAQGTQECYFYRGHDNPHWMEYNNPAGMKYYAGRFDELDAPPDLNRQGAWARFTTKRQGIKAHCQLARAYADDGYGTVAAFLNKWGTGQVSRVLDRANAIRSYPRLDPPGIRDTYTAFALSEMVSRGIMRGYPDGYLRDEWPVTRAEMAALLVRTFGAGRPAGEAPVPADAQGHWAERYIARAIYLGWMRGFPDGTFRPDDFLTRAQTCEILARIGAPGFVYREPAQLSDMRPEDWYYNSVMWAYTQGWLGEFLETDVYGGVRFLPDHPISRGEMAHLLYNVMLLQPQQPAPPEYPKYPIEPLIGAQAGTERVRLVPAVWVARERRWVPVWSVPVLVGREEVWLYPVTAVPENWVASPFSIRPASAVLIGLAAGAAGYLVGRLLAGRR